MFTNFDDGLFELESSDLNKKLPLKSYNAKFCEPEVCMQSMTIPGIYRYVYNHWMQSNYIYVIFLQWFQSSINDEDEEIFAQKLKFRADLLYHRKEYFTALDEYNKYLDEYAGKSTQMKRNFLDCKARCQLKCGYFNEAYETAKSLVCIV